MSLVDGHKELEAALIKIYKDTGSYKSITQMARLKADALFKFGKSMEPMVIIAMVPGGLVGTGVGGTLFPVPMGSITKESLETKLLIIHKKNLSLEDTAKKEAQAFFDYLSVGSVFTTEIGKGAPIGGPTEGVGGLFGPVPGKGYSTSKKTLSSALEAIYSDVGSIKVAPVMIKRLATAYHNFFKEAIIKTRGVFVAPPIVPPPFSGPGVGASIQGFTE